MSMQKGEHLRWDCEMPIFVRGLDLSGETKLEIAEAVLELFGLAERTISSCSYLPLTTHTLNTIGTFSLLLQIYYLYAY